MWQKLIEWKGERDNSVIIVAGDFNMSLSIMNRATKQMVNKELED